MLSQFAQMHGPVQLTIGNRAVDEILRKRKIAVVSAIANHAVAVMIIDATGLKQILLRLICQRRAGVKLSVLQQHCQPVQDAVFRPIQVQDIQRCQIQFVAIGKPVCCPGAGPFFGQIQALCRIKTGAIVIGSLSSQIDRLLYNVIRTVIYKHDHHSLKQLYRLSDIKSTTILFVRTLHSSNRICSAQIW